MMMFLGKIQPRLLFRWIFLFFIIGFGVVSGGCTASSASQAWQQAMQRQLLQYSDYSKAQLSSAFRRAGMTYPPQHLALLVFKNSRQLELYASNQDDHWRFIKSLPILAASGSVGPKLHQGDKQVPEGLYRITNLNPVSHYHLSMKLNYPNEFDRREAILHHRYHLGGNIFIHGKSRSVGCIAIGDSGIEQLFPLVAAVGAEDTRVIIAPADFRYKRPRYQRSAPDWLPHLYHKIQLALLQFPLPRH